MYKQTLLPLVGLGALAIAASILYFPSHEEQAVMKLKDKEFEKASKAFEKIYESGNLSPTVVRSMTQLALQEGKVDQAIKLLEQYLAKNPSDLDARKLIGTYYQYAQRTQDYVSNLEILNRLEMTKGTLEELSAIYNFHGDTDRQIAILEEVVKRADAEPKHYVSLAYLYAQVGKIKEAADVLDVYAQKDLGNFKPDILEFFVILLVDQNKPQQAFDVSKKWLDLHFEEGVAERVVNHFQNKKYENYAYTLLRNYKNKFNNNSKLEFLYATLQFQNGFKDNAYKRLKHLSDKNQIGEDFFPYFAELSLDFGDLSMLKDKMSAKNVQNLSDDILLKFSALASKADPDLLEGVLQKIDPESLEARPVFASDLYLTSGKTKEAMGWIQKALHVQDSGIVNEIDLLDVLWRAGLKNEVQKRLILLQEKILKETEIVDPLDYVRLAKIYIHLHLVEDGLHFFDTIPQNNQESTELGRVYLKASLGDMEAPLAWIQKRKNFYDAGYLEDLNSVAVQKSLYPLSLVLTKRLYDSQNTSFAQQLYGGALVMNQKYADAITILEKLPYMSMESTAYLLSAYKALKSPKFEKFLENIDISFSKKTMQDQQNFVYTLLNANAVDLAMPFMQKLVSKGQSDFIYTIVEAGKLSGDKKGVTKLLYKVIDDEKDVNKKEDFTYALIDFAGEKEALLYIGQMAELKGGNWNYAYSEALQKAGDTDTYRAFMKNWALKDETTPKERRNLAYELLEKGFKPDAIGIFQKTLDEGHTPQEQKMMLNVLLNVWGPYVRDEASVAWMIQKFQDDKKSGKTQGAGAWLSMLVDTGNYQKLFNLIGHEVSGDMQDDYIVPYLKALMKAKDKRTITAVFDKSIEKVKSVSALYELGDLSQSPDFAKVLTVHHRRQVYERIYKLNPQEPRALQQLAYIAYDQSEFESAGRYFEKLFDISKGDYVSNYFYGEVLRLKGDIDAETYYKNALHMIREAPEKDTDMLLVKGQIMSHQGYGEKSLKLISDLHYYLPNNAGVRADLAQFLLGNNKEMEAREILGF